MKTTKQVISEHPEYSKLIHSVCRNLSKDEFDDVYYHGINNGFGNFVYYKDTIRFFRNNKKEIVKYAEELSEELGENVLEMIKNFNCFGDGYELSEIAKCLYGNYSENNDVTIYNGMAWFAAEEVVRWFIDE